MSQFYYSIDNYGEDFASTARMMARNPNPPIITELSVLPDFLPYRDDKMHLKKYSVHVGQLKLELSEIKFLTKSGLVKDARDGLIIPYVVYAGSAPGHSRGNLTDMFPGFKFVLIDPQEHNIMKVDSSRKLYFRSAAKSEIRGSIDFATRDGIVNINKKGALMHIAPEQLLNAVEIANAILRETKYTYYIIEDVFTNELARAFTILSTESHPVLFISDIRTNTRAKGGRIVDPDDYPADLDIITNAMWQHMWVHIMQPYLCMLKFRCPFRNPIDIEHTKKHMAEFAGTINTYNALFHVDVMDAYFRGVYLYSANLRIDLQIYAGSFSSESRLIASPREFNQIVEYNPIAYENKLFYYNVFRNYTFYESMKPYFDRRFGVDGCADCRNAINTMIEYLRESGRDESPLRLLRDSLRRMSRTLYSPSTYSLHGNMTSRLII